MITVVARNKTINIPDSWEELAPVQYVATVELLFELIEGRLSILEFRLRLLKELTGYKRSKKRYDAETIEQINSNLFVLSERLNFPLKPVYHNPELLDVVSEELKKILLNNFIFDIPQVTVYEDELAMIRSRLNYSVAIHLNMRKNPLPSVETYDAILHGPVFNIDKNGLVDTDIVAQEYVDAMGFYILYQKTKKEDFLDRLVASLYRPEREKYDSFQCQQRLIYIQCLDINTRKGILLFFQNIQEYFLNHPVYGILFQGKEDKNVISLGMENTIYNLSKEGYGTKNEISRLRLDDYLGMLLKMLIDSVKNLRALDKNNQEIASQLHLQIETVMQI